MKISYRTHPILEKLAKKDILNYSIYGCDKDYIDKGGKKTVDDFFKAVSLGINNQIYSVTQPFIDAYEAAGDKLYNSNLWHDVEDDNICFILPSKQATCLNIRNRIKEGIIEVKFVDFIEGNILAGHGVFLIIYNTETGSFTYNDLLTWTSDNVGNLDKHILNCVIMTLFIKYAEVETKHLPAGQKIKGVDCKYVNETKMPVNILNSLWFTTLVKSDGFKVRGHFRLQPKKKNGEWTKELIWINDFMKTGYTSTAKKIKENEDC